MDNIYLHLLTLPRENVFVGDLYAYNDKRGPGSGNIVNFLEPHFALPSIHTYESVASVSGQISNNIEAGK